MTTKAINGWIVLDKPYGMSSTKASNIVRRLTGATKAGHAGTLDPLATGVLPIALGEATKTMPYVVADRKQYAFQTTWGEQRMTDDAEGGVIATSPLRPSEQAISHILPQYVGVIDQRPPLFSALKIDGKRAYDLARSGDATILKELQGAMIQKTRPVIIHDLILESIDSANEASFVLTCGPGTYVRSLARDMAENLGTVGYVSRLRRVFVGKFHQRDAISLEKLEEFRHKSELHRFVLPLGAVLDDIPAVSLTREEAMKIHQGQRVKAQRVEGQSIPIQETQSHQTLVVLKLEDQLVALANVCEGYYYPTRVFKV